MAAPPADLRTPDVRRPPSRFPAVRGPAVPAPAPAPADGADPVRAPAVPSAAGAARTTGGSRAEAEATAPRDRARSAPRVLWCGDDQGLRGLVGDHVAAAGGILAPQTEADAPPAPGSGRADLVIGTVPGLARRSPAASRSRESAPTLIAVTGEAPLDDEEWRLCLRLGVEAVVRLPQESGQLLDLLGQALRPRGGALVLGVAGGCGGAGASSLAARLAGAWARRGTPTVLVDADPLGGGLDLLVEAPASRGGAWEDVGRLDAQDGAQLREGLPVVDGVHLLTARAGGAPSPERTAAALAALAPLDGVVVADLAPGHVPAALAHLDRLALVVPAAEHAVRAAARRLAGWDGARGRCELVVRRSRGPLRPGDVSADLGLPLAGHFADSSPQLVPLLDVRRRGADKLCAQLARRWQETSRWTS
ncbi:septum formation initiator [Brachybacterium phenoliresistens]|uniref:Septum formation initiator n=1 Tax=Brachybacterium phenoliresistens TaxID=396014 RepID=Z9JQE4_9MICO|nr:hypothetical protein [Brachybacterium phenoliresistens]EWS80253.1 septum formation initiator [Brachybacterium phenoliresistens]